MLSFRIRIKLVLLFVLALSTLGLHNANACDNQHCVQLYNKDGELMGYGCAAGGGYIECYARVEGCTIVYCAD